MRLIFGKGKIKAIVKRLGWNKPNTSAIERFNLTDRQRNRRKQRQTMGFSKQTRFHDWMSWISVMWYNFHFCHRSLTIKEEEHGVKKTPAMAAHIANRPFSTLESMRMQILG